MEIIVKDGSSSTDPPLPESLPLPVPPPLQPTPEQTTINNTLTTGLAEVREAQSETLIVLRQLQSTLEEVTTELPELEPESESEETIVVEPPAPLEPPPVVNDPDKKDDTQTIASGESQKPNLFRRILLGRSKAQKA